MATYRVTVEQEDLEKALILFAGIKAWAVPAETDFVDIEVTSNVLESEAAAAAFLRENGVSAGWTVIAYPEGRP